MSVLQEIQETALKAVAKVQVSLQPPLVRAYHCRRLLQLAEAGDIVCRKYKGHLTTAFIPGEFSHSGVVESPWVDLSHPGSMIHAVGEGVGRIELEDFVKDCDGFILLRPQLDPKTLPAALEWARSKVGTAYDFQFNADQDKTLFCHHLTAEFQEKRGLNIAPEIQEILGKIHSVYLAQQFVDCRLIKSIYRTEF